MVFGNVVRVVAGWHSGIIQIAILYTYIFLLVPTSCHTYLVNQLATNLLGCDPLLFYLGSSR